MNNKTEFRKGDVCEIVRIGKLDAYYGRWNFIGKKVVFLANFGDSEPGFRACRVKIT